MKRLIALCGLLWALAAPVAFAQTAWSPTDKTTPPTLTNSNLTATFTTSGTQATRATNSQSAGKWYFEVLVNTWVDSGGVSYIGIATAGTPLSDTPGISDSTSAGYKGRSTGGGTLFANSGANTVTVGNYVAGDTLSFAVDVTNHLIWAAKNGTWASGTNPATNTGGLDYVTTSPVFPIINDSGNVMQLIGNFGATAFSYTVPTGFTAWNGGATSANGPLSLLGVGH